MGVVYLAEHPVIGRKVAMKAIHPELSRNPEVVSRFVTEAKSVNQIGHEHIVDIHDFGNTPDGEFYFIMEFLQGEALVGPPRSAARRSSRRAPWPSPPRSPTRSARRTSTASSTATSSPRTSSSSPRPHGRLREGARLRPGQADPGRREGLAQDAHRLGDGHAVLHVARAVRGQGRHRPPRRHLLAGRDPVRDADRQGAVRRRRLRRDHRQAHHRRRPSPRAINPRCPPAIEASSCARWPSRARIASRPWRSSREALLDPEALRGDRACPRAAHPAAGADASGRLGAAPNGRADSVVSGQVVFGNSNDGNGRARRAPALHVPARARASCWTTKPISTRRQVAQDGAPRRRRRRRGRRGSGLLLLHATETRPAPDRRRQGRRDRRATRRAPRR